MNLSPKHRKTFLKRNQGNENQPKKNMKRKLLVLMLFGILTTANAQEKDYKNEIGIDVTGLWKQVLGTQNFGENDYYLTYRRYFDGFNLNSAVGFQYAKSFTDETGDLNMDNSNRRQNWSINYRIGLEKMKSIHTKFNVFYGVYYTQFLSNDYNDRVFLSDGFATGQVVNISKTGFAPFVGFRYQFSSRISIETSSFLNFYYQQTKTEQFRRFVGPIAGDVPPEFTTKNTSFGVNNKIPIFLILTIKI